MDASSKIHCLGLSLYIQEIQIKVAGLTFFLVQFEVSGVSELNILVLQNNCLLYAWILKATSCHKNTKCALLKIHQTDDTTKYASTNIFK